MKNIIFVLLVLALLGGICFAEAPEDRTGELEAKVAVLKEKVATMEGEVANIQTSVLTTKEELAALTQKVNDLETKPKKSFWPWCRK